MKRIGLLGGTFNPPHIGHLLMANEVCVALNLDEVRLMPNATPPHKVVNTDASNEQRLEMVKLAVAPYENLTYESFEIEAGGISYTVDTMKGLREREPEATFYFIIGGDMIDTLHTWDRIEELLEDVQFVGVARPGTASKTKLPVLIVEVPQIDLSSTAIRQRLATGGNLEIILPEPVQTFIREEGLYGTK